jgi:hypothetical protein
MIQNSKWQNIIANTLLKGVHSIIFVCFETAADNVYISESNENWEKYSTQR